TPPANAHSIPSNPTRALLFNVNGAGNASNTTRIDGATSTNVQLPWVSSYVLTLESIEAVDVATNSFDAEQGLAGGAVINAQIKSGDMSGSPSPIYDPATGTATGTGRTPFGANQVPLARISAISRKIAAVVPLPNQPGLTNNYYGTGPFSFDRHIADAKLNWN